MFIFTGDTMQINKHYVLGLALSLALVACGKDEKTKTVTVENPKTQEALKTAQTKIDELQKQRDELQAQIKKMPDAAALKADLDKANAQVATLNKSITDKDAEIEKAKKDL